MPEFVISTKVYNKEGDFLEKGVATIDADDKEEARFLFNHGVLEMNTPPGFKIVGDLRTLKPVEQES